MIVSARRIQIFGKALLSLAVTAGVAYALSGTRLLSAIAFAAGAFGLAALCYEPRNRRHASPAADSDAADWAGSVATGGVIGASEEFQGSLIGDAPPQAPMPDLPPTSFGTEGGTWSWL